MTSPHPLDRPVWNTLASRQRSFAVGDRRARRFAGAFGLFAATADDSPECQAALAALVAEHGTVALVEAEPPPAIAGVVTEAHLIWQMAAERLTDGSPPPCAILSLADADAPEMFALATLAKPGPFFACTHRLGAFVGVRHEGALVAMAGERMKPDGFTEVSAVCTAPGHRGRGETPFLHAYAHNTAAIGLYQTLGFALRREMHMRVLTSSRTGCRTGPMWTRRANRPPQVWTDDGLPHRALKSRHSAIGQISLVEPNEHATRA